MPPLIDQFGRELPAVQRAAVPAMSAESFPGGWFPIIREPFSGAWQRNLEIRMDQVSLNVTYFRCVSLISTDIAKMRMKLVRETSPGIWEEASNPAWSPVIAQPNHFQNRIQFYENWISSKLNNGNTYVLKERDNRNVVVALYILDPRRVRPLVAPGGDVFYDLHADYLAGLPTQVRVPASEIIHDRWNCLFHPLVGLSPIVANGLVATQGLRIQEHSTRFFASGARPGGILTAPGKINAETAERLKSEWQQKFSGENAGMVAVLGDGLSYSPMGINALDSQLIEQLKWTEGAIAASFGVPPFKIGSQEGRMAQLNIEALERLYYQACLQIHIESVELTLDEGLNLPANWGVEFDLDGLLRMDSQTLMKTLSDGVGAALLAPNEGRARLNLAPKPGGDTPYLQVQNYSLAALDRRDKDSAPTTGGAGGTPPSPDLNAANAFREQIRRSREKHERRLAAAA